MIDFLIAEFSLLLELIFVYLLTCKYLVIKFTNKLGKFLCVSIPLSLVCAFFESSMEYNNFAWLMQFFLSLIAIYLIFQIPFANALLIYCLNYILIIAIQLFIAFFLTLLPGELSYSETAICGNTLTLVAIIVIYFKLQISNILNFLLRKNRVLAVIVIDLFCVFITISAYHRNHIESFYNFLIPILIMLTILIIVNWELIINQLLTEKLKRKLKAYEDYLPIVDELIDHVRSRQHDFDNQVMSLQSLPMTCTTYEELCANLGKYTTYIADQQKDANILRLNHKLVAGLIFQKMHLAKKNNCTLEITLKTTTLLSKIPEYELVDVLGILIDNVIDATPENGTSHLILDSVNNVILIKTKNVGPVLSAEFMSNIFRKGYSTKPSAHKRGYGLPNMVAILKKYKGNVVVRNEDDPETHETLIVFDIIV